MLLNLAMEYTEQINSKETPTVMTSLDRVVQQESQRIMDDLEVDFKERISDLIPQEFGFMTESGQREDVDIKEVFNNLRLDAMKLVHTSLSQILSVDEIIQRYNLFMKWLNSQQLEKQKEYYSTTLVYNIEILKRCVSVFKDRINPSVITQDTTEEEKSNTEDTDQLGIRRSNSIRQSLFKGSELKPNVIIDYCNCWIDVLSEYLKNSVGQSKYDILAEFTIDSKFIQE